MIDCLEFAEVLERAAAMLPIRLLEGCKQTAEGVAIEAKSYIGNYQAGWEPLKPATLYGGVTPEGYRYAGKVRLGYSPPDNPLLREGTLRTSIEAYAEMIPGGAMGVVGSPDKVALYQEMGTSRMVARPFLGLAMSRVEPLAEIVFGRIGEGILGRAP